MPRKLGCSQCGKKPIWMRATQFAGDHLFCDACAKKEKDFGQEDSSYFFWKKIPDKNSGRRKRKTGK